MRAAKLFLLFAVVSVVIVVAASPVPRVGAFGTGPVYLASGRLLANTHEVVGRVTGTSPINVELAGPARFAEATSYFCTASGADQLQTLGPQVVNIDGSRFRVIHGAADPATVVYRCVGM